MNVLFTSSEALNDGILESEPTVHCNDDRPAGVGRNHLVLVSH